MKIAMRACLSRRVPGGTRKAIGAADARFGPNPQRAAALRAMRFVG